MPTIYRLAQLTVEQQQIVETLPLMDACEVPTTQQAIANATKLTKKQVSDAIRALQAIGLVKRCILKGGNNDAE